jgi:hypothetical protein
MKEYTFDVGDRNVTINARSERDAWSIIQQFGSDGDQITLLGVQEIDGQDF